MQIVLCYWKYAMCFILLKLCQLKLCHRIYPLNLNNLVGISKWLHAILTQNLTPPICPAKICVLSTPSYRVSQKYILPTPYLHDVIYECPHATYSSGTGLVASIKWLYVVFFLMEREKVQIIVTFDKMDSFHFFGNFSLLE